MIEEEEINVLVLTDRGVNRDFAAVPAVSKAHVMALAEADSWIGQGHNLLAFGPPPLLDKIVR